jgi:aminodeoxyfutalosine synthase
LENKKDRFGLKATYVINYSVNPSNLCSSQCKFCHYHAQEGDPHAYILSQEEILAPLAQMKPKEIHITGGLNDSWNLKNSLSLITEIHRLYPNLFIKAFTAVEIDSFAVSSKTSPKVILQKLQVAGLQSLTGGGAEMFSPRLREKYCPQKISPESWLGIHQAAHSIGIASNATMLYGIGETDQEIVDHFLTLREAQDRSRGFSCFIPLAYQPEKNKPQDRGPSALENLRIIALARLLLDNFDHIKAYWPMIGLATAAVALSFGADDLDGTLGKERIAHSGAAKSPEFLSRTMMEDTIRSGGFVPMERGGDFTPVQPGPDV